METREITFEAVCPNELCTKTHGWVSVGQLIGQAIDYINSHRITDGLIQFPDQNCITWESTVELGSFIVAKDGTLNRQIACIGIDIKEKEGKKREFTILGININDGELVKSIAGVGACGEIITRNRK